MTYIEMLLGEIQKRTDAKDKFREGIWNDKRFISKRFITHWKQFKCFRCGRKFSEMFHTKYPLLKLKERNKSYYEGIEFYCLNCRPNNSPVCARPRRPDGSYYDPSHKFPKLLDSDGNDTL